MALFVGLTGGIGSGKSTVSGLLAQRGAVVIDADAISRRLAEPGGVLHGRYVELFGEEILRPDGTIDRPRVAALVFGDREKLAQINAVAHPAIGLEMARQRAEQEATDNVVVLDIPLLAEGQAPRENRAIAAVIVVDAPVEAQIERLTGQRGMAEDDARARIAAQADRQARLALADFVVDNSGDLDHLDAEVDRCWAWLQDLRGRAAS